MVVAPTTYCCQRRGVPGVAGERYRDVAGLNDAWGTAFWSQRYDDFEQVLPPRIAPTTRSHAAADFRRFSSDQLLDNFVVERDVLHRSPPACR